METRPEPKNEEMDEPVLVFTHARDVIPQRQVAQPPANVRALFSVSVKKNRETFKLLSHQMRTASDGPGKSRGLRRPASRPASDWIKIQELLRAIATPSPSPAWQDEMSGVNTYTCADRHTT
jgi:hypothetical protein